MFTSKIVLAAKKDLKDIVETNLQLHRNLPKFNWDKPKWIEKEIEKGYFFILRKNSQVFGAINLKEEGKDELYIETIAVKPEFQNKGYGKKLIRFAQKLAKERGKNKLTVESFYSYGLLNYYLKQGFKLDNPSTDYYGKEPFYRFVMEV